MKYCKDHCPMCGGKIDTKGRASQDNCEETCQELKVAEAMITSLECVIESLERDLRKISGGKHD